MLDNDIKLLSNFFSSYFHQDWDFEHDCTTGVIREYLSDGYSPTHLAALSDAITRLVQQAENEKELEDQLFGTLGCYYTPSLAGRLASDWLREIASQLASHRGDASA